MAPIAPLIVPSANCFCTKACKNTSNDSCDITFSLMTIITSMVSGVDVHVAEEVGIEIGLGACTSLQEGVAPGK